MMPELPSFIVRGEDGEEYGPVAYEEMREWVQENRAGVGTEVRRDEPGSPWQLFQEFPELVALAAEATAVTLPGFVLAPLGRRVIAFGADLILFYILCIPIAMGLVVIFAPEWIAQCMEAANHATTPFYPPDMPQRAGVIIEFMVQVVFGLYFAGFIAAHGKTPAKQVLRLRVVDQDGNKPDLMKSVVRAIVLVLSVILFFIPLTYAFFNPERRALHDFVAGTYVVEA